MERGMEMTTESNRNETMEKAGEKTQEMRAKAEEKVDELKEQAGAQADAMLDNSEQIADERKEQAAYSLDHSSDEIHTRADQAQGAGQAGRRAARNRRPQGRGQRRLRRAVCARALDRRHGKDREAVRKGAPGA